MSRKIGHRIIHFNEINSTNSYLKSNHELLQQHGLVVRTDMQTSGRGRASRKFVSLPGQNLTFSVVLHPRKHVSEIQIYSLLASVVDARVLENYVNSIRLKWPNDVIVSQKKISASGTLHSDENDSRFISLAAFYIDRTEVTVENFKKYQSRYNEKPYINDKSCPKCPAMGINFNQAWLKFIPIAGHFGHDLSFI